MSTHSVLTMATFGLGTAPGMILTGAASIVRDASFISAAASQTAHCPVCGP